MENIFFFFTLSGARDRQDVRVQETREEADKEAQGRSDGFNREADPGADQLALRRQPRVRVRDERRALSRSHHHERYLLTHTHTHSLIHVLIQKHSQPHTHTHPYTQIKLYRTVLSKK